jgi:PAS domain S-box-containing protein
MIAPLERPMNILLVEDDAADARMVGEMLREEHAPAVVTHTRHLSEALAHLERGGFNVVLLDLTLPDSAGIDTFVRTRLEAPGAPIVVLTGLADATLAARAVREGAQDYLVKGEVTGRSLHRSLRYAVERHAAEEALRASEERFRQLAENIREVFVVVDVPSHAVRYVSPTWSELWSQSVSEAYAGPDGWMTAVEPADQAALRDAIASASVGIAADVSFRIIKGDVGTTWARARLFPVGGHGTPRRFVGLIGDITEERRRETQLMAAQRMEAVGRLAGGIAHDFNNLLTVILASAQLLGDDLGDAHPLEPRVAEIASAAESAAALTAQLLAFSRQQVHQPRLLQLNDIVRRAQPLLQRLIGDNIDLSIALGDSLPTVRADASQLEQILVNLVANARDAMPGGGRIVIATTQEHVTEDEAATTPGTSPGSHVVLSVTDSGIGMDSATQQRVFEPFFTTKEMGKGTGLGLATVYGVVKQSGGSIWVESQPGRGTTFRVLLPAQSQPAAPTTDTVAPVSTPARGGVETILVVEDRKETRQAIVDMLRRHGYTVLDAGDGATALSIAQRHRGGIDLLLTDVVMPGLSGRDLAAALSAASPETRVLFMSGYPGDVIGHHGVLDASVAFIQKPFSLEILLRKVRSALADDADEPGSV